MITDNISLRDKKIYSFVLCGLFLLLLILMGIYIQIFHSSSTAEHSLMAKQGPLSAEVVDGLNQVRLKNRLGAFTVRLNKDQQWELTSPKQVSAREDFIKKIRDLLSSIKVTSIHNYDPINIANFSLDRPLLSLRLFTKLDEQYSLQFGLVNPVNETTYLSIEGKKVIYQINKNLQGLEKIEFTSLLDSRLFRFDHEAVQKISIFRGNDTSARNELSMIEQSWISKNYKHINQEHTQKTISSFLNLAVHTILDQKSELLENFLENTFKRPLYLIVIKTKDGTEYRYEVSSLVKSVPGQNVLKNSYFIMRGTGHRYPFLMPKATLSKFNIRYQNLK